MKEKKRVNPLIRTATTVAWVILATIILQACSGDGNEAESAYTVENERFDDSGMYYVDIDTEAASEEEIKSVLKDVMDVRRFEQNDVVTSAFVRVHNNDTVIANAKIAYDNKGLAQTGLDEEREWSIEMQ